jgi:hypothetical protein
MHKWASPVSSGVNFTGVISVLLCEPSQKGCLLLNPQAHQFCSSPFANSTFIDFYQLFLVYPF